MLISSSLGANESAFASARIYLEALDAASGLLIDTNEDTIGRVLQAISLACDAKAAAVYRHRVDDQVALLTAVWLDDSMRVSQDGLEELSEFDYSAYSSFYEELGAGLILVQPISELMASMRALMGCLDIGHFVAVPLLSGSDLIGFIVLLTDAPLRDRPQLEARLLSTLANFLSLAFLKQETEDRLRANEMRLKTLVGATEDMVFEIDEVGVIVNLWSTHPAMPQAVLVGMALERALPRDMAWSFRQALPKVLKSGRLEQVEFTIPRLDGTIYFIGRLEAVPSADGVGTHAVALVRDVTDLMREEAGRQVMAQTLNLLEEAIIDLTPDGRLAATSAAWGKLRGLSREEQGRDQSKSLIDLAVGEDVSQLSKALVGVAETGDPVTQRFRLMRETAEPMWVEARLIAIRDGNSQVVSLRGVLRDVTVAYMNERHIMKLALYDGLTGLPNRVMLDDLLHQSIARARRNNSKVALGFIDLDHFKQINDAFGHQAGDRTLVTIAKQLKSVLREEDVLARWGGDEFVVLIPDIEEVSTLGYITERLREIARQGIVLDGIETRPTISIGMAIFPDNAETGEELMSAADSTMYHAKSAGRNNVQFYGDIMHLKSLSREHMAIQTRLNAAVLDNELQVFYQPIVHALTGEVSSVEALVRWHDDASGWVTPSVFIPMAERLGLIQEMSEQVLVQSLGRLKNWRDRGLKQRLAINVSRNLLFSPRLLQTLLELISQYSLRPDDIIIEITESLALTDYSRQSKQLRELHKAGFRIAIDDFGTGYSSLSQLHDMPIDLLKVDISFTARLNTQSGRRIMQAIVQMGQALGLEVVVEGVESLDMARFLQGLGVEKMQGFYFSEAVPAGVCELMMQLGMQSKL